MRRIIFGAIWLTGFLAVLLSWGMMWTRAQGDAPARMAGRKSSEEYSCQVGMTIPESNLWRPIVRSHNSCGLLGWSDDHRWIYYLASDTDYEPYVYRIGRIDSSLHHKEILVDGIVNGPFFFTPGSQYIVFQDEYPNEAGRMQRDWFSITTDGQHLQNLTLQLRLAAGHESLPGRPHIDPSGNWMVMEVPRASDDYANNDLYRIALDGHAVEQVPNFVGNLGYVILWTDTPEWLVVENRETNDLYKIRPDGSDPTPLSWGVDGVRFEGWTHPSGMIGLMQGDTFSAVWVDTGEVLWRLEGVEGVYIGLNEKNLRAAFDEEWVNLKMWNGTFARCRLDGSQLTFYQPKGYKILNLWGWSPDGDWVWFETPGSNPNVDDVMRVQQNTGVVELMLDDVNPLTGRWSPDGKWAYYYDYNSGPAYHRIRLDGSGKPEIVLSEDIRPFAELPPYQAEWQPARTLILGIGLMSFSTLTPIVLWRRRRKPRTT